MFARHSLVWLSARGWQQAHADLPSSAHAALDAWQQADWPLITRRADPDTAADRVCLGLAPPPDPRHGGKTRIALQAHQNDLTKVIPPLPLAAVIDCAPQRWQGALRVLEAQARSQQVTLRVYGSLALQTLTRQAYVSETSDIDLLLPADSAGSLQRGLALIERHAEHLPLDGEIVFPSGQAVAWKEWRNALRGARGERVLVKGRRSVALEAPAVLLASLRASVQDLRCAP